MGDTSRSQTVSTKLQKIAEQALRYPDTVFTTLMYHIDAAFLREAYRRTRKDAAPGVDGVTAQQHAEHLEENLQALHARMRGGRYKAPPVKRVWRHWLSRRDRQHVITWEKFWKLQDKLPLPLPRILHNI